MNIFLLGFGAVAATLSGVASSAAPSQSKYLVKMEIHDGDAIVARPRLTVLAGSPDQVTVGSTRRLFDVSFSVMPDRAQPRSLITVPIKIVVSSGDKHARNRRTMTTTLTFAPKHQVHFVVAPSPGVDTSPVYVDMSIDTLPA